MTTYIAIYVGCSYYPLLSHWIINDSGLFLASSGTKEDYAASFVLRGAILAAITWEVHQIKLHYYENTKT